jgi:hypothetical protein
VLALERTVEPVDEQVDVTGAVEHPVDEVLSP